MFALYFTQVLYLFNYNFYFALFVIPRLKSSAMFRV
jgi:hypothetical protein